MAFPTKLSISQAYNQIKDRMIVIRRESVALHDAAASGPINFSSLRIYYENTYSNMALVNARVPLYSAADWSAYAQTEESDPTLDIVAEKGAVQTAVDTVIAYIAGVLHANSSHTVSGGLIVEPQWTTAQTATLRTHLQGLIATINT